MATVTPDYISAGGNRHPAAADWDRRSGVLAFGADNNVALWDPRDSSHRGVYSLLVGHTDKVSAVRFYTCPTTRSTLLLTGSVDRTIRVWTPDAAAPHHFKHAWTLEGHGGSVNVLAVADGTDVLASGAADGNVNIWRLSSGGAGQLLQTVTMKPRFFPLALSLSRLQTDGEASPLVLAVAGTTSVVQVYAAESVRAEGPGFKLCAVLSGHEGWVRSLVCTQDKQSPAGDLLFASASQDKYIRLWRLHRGEVIASMPTEEEDPMLGGMEPTLTNKAHEFEAGGSKYSITFEALLFGNEDWIYTAAWNPDPERQQLLSASADNTLTIWEQDPVSGVWMSTERMGELSVQKGSTTATGTAGGFWIGLWAPDGKQVVSLGRTGSWKLWVYDADSDMWVQGLGTSGHVRSVNGVQWDSSGGYLLSTSADQTTRLHAQWIRDGVRSWHEFSRPQVHGYDLNCIDTLGPARFVSGADEKLLRVFNEPRPISRLLENLSGVQQEIDGELPDTARMPVLGLSNKSLEDEGVVDGEEADVPSQPAQEPFDLSRPPFEDQLARYTLWPEHEKLYGHGYEISAVAVSHDKTLIATACKASSIDHAVIRLYDTSDWHEIKPSLAAHTLTITDLCFSEDDRYLLSVGRDRQWAVFQRNDQEPSLFSMMTSNPKGHSRMILGAAWAPTLESPVFATAGRDKSVKLWQKVEDGFACKSTIPLKNPVTALSFLQGVHNGGLVLAAGDDSGEVSLHRVSVDNLEAKHIATVDRLISPSRAITQLSWRPVKGSVLSDHTFELAVASEDTSTRIYAISKMLS
ncbi:hypothetical protein PHISP_02385 [Aspergillus sp. HF37]|nr:hypothetical protein PHISP_02385 [Aspergillus sp. HF37]